jgi:excinuclease UvrABC ATPase subunit
LSKNLHLAIRVPRIGTPHCYNCGKPVRKQSTSQIIDSILNQLKGKKVSIFSPVVKGRKGHYRELFEEILSDGFLRVRVDGEVKEITKGFQVDRYKIHNIEIVVDRLIVKETSRSRITESVGVALNYVETMIMFSAATWLVLIAESVTVNLHLTHSLLIHPMALVPTARGWEKKRNLIQILLFRTGTNQLTKKDWHR